MNYLTIIVFGMLATIAFGTIIVWAAIDELNQKEEENKSISEWIEK